MGYKGLNEWVVSDVRGIRGAEGGGKVVRGVDRG